LGDLIKFSMTALALKLLGKNLYSNPWAALSELVANGCDAGASVVKVIFDHVSEAKYDIYVVDNGSGMDQNDMQRYAKIGYDKRKAHEGDPNTVMGRKGIGKLAGLYLSNRFNILTKKYTELFFTFDFNDYHRDLEKEPALQEVNMISINPYVSNAINDFASYTVVHIQDVNLSGYGGKAYETFENRLANLFSTEALPVDLEIIHFDNESNPLIRVVKKKVAFKNMILINQYGSGNQIPEEDLVDLTKNTLVKVPKGPVEYAVFQRRINTPVEQTVEISYDNKTRQYPFSGWIGMHATIKTEHASKNDDRFQKNQYYNPIQLRVYVRKKLAISNLLTMIKNNQTYANYVEGELHFDALDLNDEEDIATTNRESVDETDPRVSNLIDKIKNVITMMIRERAGITEEINKKIELETQHRADIATKSAYSTAKQSVNRNVKKFSERYKVDKSAIETIQDDALGTLSMQLKTSADIRFKDNYKLFFSHRKISRVFSDIVWDLLTDRGATDNELFYTTKQSHPVDLNNVIKQNITNDVTMCIYFFSKDFRTSDYPMFEAGAGWATKSTDIIFVLSDKYNNVPSIPEFNANTVVCFSRPFNDKFYIDFTASLNEMINHLNKGREISGTDKLRLFTLPNFPLMKDRHDSTESYVDSDIISVLSSYGEELGKYLD